MALQNLPAEFYQSFLSDLAKERKPSPIRGLYPLEGKPGLISLLAGKPNPDTFPLTSITLTSHSPTDAEKKTQITTEIGGRELAEGLQYGPTAGLPSMIEWVFGLQEKVHGRKKGEGWRVSIGGGSQDVIYKAVNSMVNPGESLLVESPVYAGVLPMFQALHCDLIEVETDSNGISSDSLRKTLEKLAIFKAKAEGSIYCACKPCFPHFPAVLINLTPKYGCNPTGMTATTERRKKVLALAKEHNFIILEDDPYFYLYYGDAPRPPSYFSLELELPEVGRVLRFDSLSKILSSGLRIGFVSGPDPLLQAIDMHTAISSLQTSSLTQTIAFALLNQWGYDDFLTHTRNVSAFYRQKRDVFEAAMQKHLKGLAEWDPPQAGLFFWFKLLLDDNDSQALVRTRAYENGVLALPGTVFLPDGRKTAYVRAAFSLVDEEQAFEACRRLSEVVRAGKIEWGASYGL